MEATHLDALLRSLTGSSRRSLLTALLGGVAAAGSFGLNGEDASAKAEQPAPA